MKNAIAYRVISDIFISVIKIIVMCVKWTDLEVS
jgi:hypothetical protein